MTHFMYQDQYSEPDAKITAVKNEVEPQKCGKTEKKFELKDGEERLAFRKGDGDGSERAESACPSVISAGGLAERG